MANQPDTSRVVELAKACGIDAVGKSVAQIRGELTAKSRERIKQDRIGFCSASEGALLQELTRLGTLIRKAERTWLNSRITSK